MRLSLTHGRSHPDEDLDGWGFEGPTLQGVTSVSTAYATRLRLTFVDAVAADRAQAQTGWQRLDGVVLEAVMDGDLLPTPFAVPPGGGGGAWFGDWVIDHDLDGVVDALPSLLWELSVGERGEFLRRLGTALRCHAPEAADVLEFPTPTAGDRPV